MPQWTSEPDTNVDSFVFRILRTPATAKLTGIITCPDLVGCNTHYASNRTIPCEGPDTCKLCADGFSWRWHGYVSALITPTLEHVLFEITATASDVFKTYHLLHGTIRACKFQAHRPSKRSNGRVVIATAPGDPQHVRLPDPPDIRKTLCHIWNIRYDKEQPTEMTRPPFKTISVDDNGHDGRYRTPA